MATPWGAVRNGYTLEPYANLEGANLRNLDLQGANLAYANLRGADLRNSNLTFANAWNADFRDADLRNTNFTKTMLRRSNFEGARFGNTYLFNAKCDDCNFAKVRFGAGTDFSRAGLYRANFTEADFGSGENTRLEMAQLNWAYLRKMDLRTTRIGWASLKNADFGDSNLSGKSIGHWDINGARFQRCDMRGVVVDGLIAEDLDFEYANLEDSRFINSTIHSRISFNNVRAIRSQFENTFFNIDSYWEGADLRYTRWNGSNIRGAWIRASDFTGSEFNGCGMRGMRAQGTNFQDCRFDACNMRETDLRAASFEDARLSNMNTEDVSMNDTKWTQTYLPGSVFNNVNICGAYTWDEAIFNDNGKQARLFNVKGPDCYLYFADREDREDIVPI